MPLITAEEYFGFVFAMVLTFGVSFELPIVVLALAALGIVTPQFLSKYRRHAVVADRHHRRVPDAGRPGVDHDLRSSVPLYALYELSVARGVRHLPAERAQTCAARCRGRRAVGGAWREAVVGDRAALFAVIVRGAQHRTRRSFRGCRPIAARAIAAGRSATRPPIAPRVKWPTPDSVDAGAAEQEGLLDHALSG